MSVLLDAGPDADAPTARHARRAPILEARDLTKSYPLGATTVDALRGVSLSVAAGEFVALMGPSGSGKSTLLQLLGGLDRPTTGEVVLEGEVISRLSDDRATKLRRDRTGFVFQSFNLIPTLTAEENILLPLSIAGAKADTEWYQRVIEAVGLADRLSHRPSELSGGQQQRVAAARALASKPAIVFADEPSGNLDSRSGAELLDFMRLAVDEFDQTIVMVTHDPMAASHSDRIVFLDDGKIVDEMVAPTVDGVLEKMKTLGD
jgi:putative ABC transport system ATP-binding protein